MDVKAPYHTNRSGVKMSAQVFPGARCLSSRALPGPTRGSAPRDPRQDLSWTWHWFVHDVVKPIRNELGTSGRLCYTRVMLRRLDELFAKLDGFFDQAKQIYGDAITCHAGCDDCCKRRFSVTLIEALALIETIERLPLETRREIRDRALREETSCPLLGTNGRCAAYEARPTICRSHGLPIRFPADDKRHSLPIIDACPKNFLGMNVQNVDPKGVLDQTTASTILAALDAAYADMAGTLRGQRVEIVDLCREVCPDEPTEA